MSPHPRGLPACLMLLVFSCADRERTPSPTLGETSSAEDNCPSTLYTATNTSTYHPPRRISCGNFRKSPWDGYSSISDTLSPGGHCLPCFAISGPKTPATCDPTCCRSKATDPSGNTVAIEKVEIRGWIVPRLHDGFADDATEFVFHVMLDLDWDLPPCHDPSVTPINSLATLSSAISPHNLVKWGARLQPPIANTLGHAHGGPESIVIHVEVNAWEGHAVPALGGATTGWIPFDFSGSGGRAGLHWIYDPFNPPILSAPPPDEPAYVRVVGTLWEDEPHTGSSHGLEHTAQSCWDEGHNHTGTSFDGHQFGRGYFEIHGVDYMAIVPRVGRPAINSSKFSVLALCSGATVTNWEVPAPNIPHPGGTLRVEHVLLGDFNFGNPSPAEQIIRFPDSLNPDRIRVTVGAPGSYQGSNGKYMSLFRVLWIPPPPPATPSVNLTLPCGEAVQISTDAPQTAPDGTPLAIVYRRRASPTAAWTDLTSYGGNRRIYLDQTFVGTTPPTAALEYQVCVRDGWSREVCSSSSIGISGTDPNRVFCNGVCTDLGNDPHHCGSCDIACPETCSARQCTCPSGTTLCQNLNLVCTDVRSDPENCGACNHPCPGGHACVNSSCSTACPPSVPDLCGNTCVDLTSDSNHCGTCAHRCPSGSYCDQSSCHHGRPQ